MTFQRGCSKTNATCDACGAGIAYPSGAFEPTPGFSGVCVTRSFVFYIALGRLLFDIFLPLYCLSVFDLLLPITPLVSSNLKDTGTIKRHWHHLATQDIERRQRDNQEWTINRHWHHLGTQDTGGKQNTGRRRINNQEWTIKRHWHHWVHKTHDEDKGTIKNGQSRDTDTIWVHKSQDKDKDAIKNLKKICFSWSKNMA
jgi:hypothetical protein